MVTTGSTTQPLLIFKSMHRTVLCVLLTAICMVVTATEMPFYRVIAPNGGEQFHIGDTITVRLASHSYANANCNLNIGRYTFPLEDLLGFTGSFNPSIDSLTRFEIPSSFSIFNWNSQTLSMDEIPFVPISDQCLIHVFDYAQATTNIYYDYSDTFFSIIAAVAINNRPSATIIHQPLITLSQGGHAIHYAATRQIICNLHDLAGRVLKRFTLDAGHPNYLLESSMRGTYVLSMKHGTELQAIKLVIQY